MILIMNYSSRIKNSRKFVTRPTLTTYIRRYGDYRTIRQPIGSLGSSCYDFRGGESWQRIGLVRHDDRSRKTYDYRRDRCQGQLEGKVSYLLCTRVKTQLVRGVLTRVLNLCLIIIIINIMSNDIYHLHNYMCGIIFTTYMCGIYAQK